MNARLPIPAVLAATAILAIAPLTRAAGGSIFLAEKIQNNLQTSASTATADPNSLFVAGFQSPVAATFTPPGASAVTPVLNTGNSDYEIYQEFATQTALNTAFPNGSYQVSGTSIPTTNFSFTGDLYPSVVPSITGGTWLPGGILVLNPAVSNTININTFSTYATAGVAGEMQLSVNSDLAPSSLNNVGTQVATQAVFGLTASATPFTSYTIPASTLTSGGIYDIKLQFNTLSSLDTTSFPSSGLISIYGSHTVAYVIAQPGTAATDTPPAISSQPTDQTASIGGTATFSFGENFDTKTVTLFFFNGQGLDINNAHYGYLTGNKGLVQLTINNVTAADAGTYYAVFVNPGGVVESQSATLTTTVASAPVVITQPNLMENDPSTGVNTTKVFVNTGSTAVLTTVISGGPSYQWYQGATPLTDSVGTPAKDIISGSTGPQLVIRKASVASNGNYTCKATNGGGSVTTNAASLYVETAAKPGYLIAISARAFVGTNDNILIGGFYIVGSTSRTVLIQAIGPGLIPPPYSVAGTLPDPTVSIHHPNPEDTSQDQIVAQNTGWTASGSAAEVTNLLAVAAKANAYPTLQNPSADSELLLTLPPGGYTAEVAGASGDTGVALCAIYELN
jgi:hypothetical protein